MYSSLEAQICELDQWITSFTFCIGYWLAIAEKEKDDGAKRVQHCWIS
jgi:hypothetical protein